VLGWLAVAATTTRRWTVRTGEPRVAQIPTAGPIVDVPSYDTWRSRKPAPKGPLCDLGERASRV